MSAFWPGEWDRLVDKLEDWILKKHHGYTQLNPIHLSKSYQTLTYGPGPNFPLKNVRSTATSQGTCPPPPPPPTDTERGERRLRLVSPKSDDERLERCLTSLDKMEKALQRYERSFAKLRKRGGPSPISRRNINTNNNNNLSNKILRVDVLDEEVINNLFHKSYFRSGDGDGGSGSGNDKEEDNTPNDNNAEAKTYSSSSTLSVITPSL